MVRRILSAALLLASLSTAVASARDNGFFAPRGRPTEDAAIGWLETNWVGRCFPDFVSELRPVPDRSAIPTKPGPFDTATGPFDVGTWNDGVAVIPSFLQEAILTVRGAQGGRYDQLLAFAYDATRRTAVFEHVGNGERFGGFVIDLDGAPAGMPVIDATKATNNAGPSMLAISAAPLRPGFTDLVRALGYPRDVRQACGYREIRYENPDPRVMIDARVQTAYQFVAAIIDGRGIVRAVGTGTLLR